MITRRPVIGLLVLWLCAGCGNFGAVTEIHPDGSWTRESRYSTSDELSGPTESFEVTIREDLEDYFDFTGVEKWEKDARNELGGGVLIMSRRAQPGETLSDFALKGEDGKVIARNEVTVTRLSEKRFEYKETLRWVGPIPELLEEPSPERVQYFAGKLPEDIEQADRVAKELTRAAVQQYVLLLYGGTGQRPLLSEALVHRNVALRKLQARLRKGITADLQERLKGHPQHDRLADIVAKIVDSEMIQQLGEKDEDKDVFNDDRSLIALDFTAKLPGKIIETNGELDEVTGEIYWTLFAASPVLEDVVLRAVCEIE
ncbi:MAG: hypothetical protein RL885_02410 [Planctomycetota bacterium]